MKNLKTLTALAAVMLAGLAAPMAAAHGTNTTCIPTGFVDKHDAVGDAGAGTVLSTETGHYYLISQSANLRDLTVSGNIQFKVMKDNPACDVVQDWQSVDAGSSPFVEEDLPTGVDLFILLRPIPDQNPPLSPAYSFAAA